MDEFIKVAGFDVQLVKKAVKYLRITVNRGVVKVTAPVRLSLREIEDMVNQKSDWIAKQLARTTRPPELPRGYAGGDTLRLWGTYRPVSFDRPTGGGIFIRAKSEEEARRSAVLAMLRRETLRAAASRLPLWEEVTGLKSTAISVRNMTSRWGTCNTQSGKLTFSLFLAHKPPECLDYIIVHELCHLSVKNHGAPFKALMDKFYPDWRKVRKLLQT